MKKWNMGIVALLAVATLSACSDKNEEDPVLNTEAAITAFTFDTSVEANKIVTSQPVINGNEITFTVDGLADALEIDALVPTVTVSKGALYSFNGSFNQKMTYEVVSEDGATKNTYTVTCTGSMFKVYEGSLTVTLDGQELASDLPYNLSLEKEEAGTVKVFISDFSITMEQLGTISLGDVEISGCTPTKIDGGYQFSGTKDMGTLEVPILGNPMTADCVIDVADAQVVNGNLTVPMVIHVSAMGGMLTMDVNANYVGTPML